MYTREKKKKVEIFARTLRGPDTTHNRVGYNIMYYNNTSV